MAQVNPPRPLVTPEQRVEEQQDRFQTSVARSRTFFEENRTLLIGAAVAVVALIAGVSAFLAWRAAQDAEAEEALGTVLSVYEAGDLERALEGTDSAPGLLEIADEYGGATAAPFFAGDALFQLGRLDEAARYFDMVDDDALMGASAVAGRAAVYEAQGENERAADLYERAAGLFKSEATAPGYLLDAGRAYEAEYAWRLGFTNVTVLDVAAEPLAALAERVPDFPAANLVEGNFFDHIGQYDLVLEQTFFCALPPRAEVRRAYAEKMHALLVPDGKLVGLWFDFPLDPGADSPPYGGSRAEYLGYLAPFFTVESFATATNSIKPRRGRELFGIFRRKELGAG